MNKVIKYIPQICLAAVLIVAIIFHSYNGMVAASGLWALYLVFDFTWR